VTSASRARRVGMCLGALLFFTSRADGSGLPPGFVYLRDVAPDIVQDIRYASLDNFTGANDTRPVNASSKNPLRKPSGGCKRNWTANLWG
jgi:D-alanyl-D-alanine dipeptidase